MSLFLAILPFISLVAQKSDREQIEEVLWNYIKGRNNGNIEMLRSAFHPNSDLRHIKNGELRVWPSEEYISIIKPGRKSDCVARIVFIDQYGNGAVAKIEIEYPNRKYADYINLLKDDEKWFIAVKSFSLQATNPKRILFVLTSHEKLGKLDRKTGFHLGEVSHVYKPLHEAGYEIDFVSPMGGATYMYGADMNDDKSRWMIQDPGAYYKLTHAYNPSQIDPSKYAAIYFVGGHGTMWDLPGDDLINKITASIYENQGVVSGVCHGPSGLVNVKLSDGKYLVDGKQLTAFSDSEETAAGKEDIVPFLLESQLKARGAQFSSAENWQEHIVVDGRLITGQNPASAAGIAEELIKILEK